MTESTTGQGGVLFSVGKAVVRRVTRPKTLVTLAVASIISFFLFLTAYHLDFQYPPFANQNTTSDRILVSEPEDTIRIEPSPVYQLPPEPQASAPSLDLDPWDSSLFVNGPPTMSFRDNLRNDTKYVSSWIAAGWTNDVMTYVNLIYLAMITDRVPIIGLFTPSHGEDDDIHFSDVFDIVRLRKELRIPILEWHEVKDENSEIIDEIGCWNVWETVQYDDHHPRESRLPYVLGLDISYTKAPDYIKLRPGNPHDKCSTFWSLATLAFPTRRNENLRTPLPSPRNQVLLPPDEHMLCYDYLYYVCAYEGIDFEEDYSPAFRHIARHMYWTQRLEDLAAETLRRAMGVSESEDIPPYITVHARHGEFTMWCEAPVESCFAPLSVIARRVQEVKEELQERKGISINHIIMTSDEKDPAWWQEVLDMGWVRLDHSQNLQLYGTWYPPLLEAVIQSHSAGFVGTDRSTFSMMAEKRVTTWHDGVVRYFKWGKPGADDH